MMDTVTLKNGATEARPAVAVIMHSISNLPPVVLYELVERCRDSDHKLFGSTGETLAALKLITLSPDGRVSIHDTIRNIVLSAVSGEGLDMVLGWPVATEVARYNAALKVQNTLPVLTLDQRPTDELWGEPDGGGE